MQQLFQKYFHKVKFYPSNDNFTQALLVMLVTNMISGGLIQTHFCLLTKLFMACQNDSEVLKHVLQKGGGDIWSILTLNDVFFLGKMEKTRVAEGGFTYSHNIISIYHPKWWFFGEDQKCSWGPKMKNKPNFFFDNRGFPNWGRGGSATWEFFPHNPVFFLTASLNPNIFYIITL